MDKGKGVSPPALSVMLAVPDAPAAETWYKKALGATELWNLGGVAGLQIAGAAFFVGEPASNGWESPGKLGITTTCIEVFCDDPDAFIAQAVAAGANGSFDNIRNHEAPWVFTARAGSSIRSGISGWWVTGRLCSGSLDRYNYFQTKKYSDCCETTLPQAC